MSFTLNYYQRLKLAGSKTKILIITASVILLSVLAVSGRSLLNYATGHRPKPVPAGKVVGAPTVTATRPQFIRIGLLQPHARDLFRTLDSRLQQPGHERLSLSGTLQRAGGTPAPVQLTLEFPHKLRLIEGNQTNALGFDGQAAWKGSDSLKPEDSALLELLVYDSPDHFFWRQAEGFPGRLLGRRFSDPDPAKPVYDIYQINDEVNLGAGATPRLKLFYFNSDTNLLERVTYQQDSAGTPVKVEVELADWRQVNGQMLPGSITRRENGAITLEFTINSASVSSIAADGLFTPSRTR